jgi:hypothetical protein
MDGNPVKHELGTLCKYMKDWPWKLIGSKCDVGKTPPVDRNSARNVTDVIEKY